MPNNIFVDKGSAIQAADVSPKKITEHSDENLVIPVNNFTLVASVIADAYEFYQTAI
jgi:hypothetical protein